MARVPVSDPLAVNPRGEPAIQVRQAAAEDWPALRELLHQAELMECLDPPEEVYAGLAAGRTFLAWAEGGLAGALQYRIRRQQYASLRALAARHTPGAPPVVKALLAAAGQSARGQGATVWWYLAPPGSVGEALRHQGFRLEEEVIELAKGDDRVPALGNREARLRPVQEGDFPRLVALDEAAFAPFWRHDLLAFQSYLARGHTFLVAELGGEVAGYLVVEEMPTGLYVIRVAVDPPQWGRGVGTRLLGEAIAMAREQGAFPVRLNTQRSNRRARRLYAWFGFRPTGRSLWAWTRPIGGL
ncbi:MAG: GNAT family N-acetyltransferase [Anaerolineae bacterium]|nr:GNAT family N-acetyltransferase [Anaerolineae bacterium]